MNMKETTRRGIFKVSVAIAAIIIAYLFALNGRYTFPQNNFVAVFDKWTCTTLFFDDDNGYTKAN